MCPFSLIKSCSSYIIRNPPLAQMMRLKEVFEHRDTLNALCDQFTCMKMLARLSMVCKRTHDYLMYTENGHKHWWRIAVQKCGFTTDTSIITNNNSGEPINWLYKCQTSVCPWLFGVYNVKPEFCLKEDTTSEWECSNILQWMVKKDDDRLIIRCVLNAKNEHNNILLADSESSGISFKCGQFKKVEPEVFVEMDEFTDNSFKLSSGMEKLVAFLGNEGFYPDDRNVFRTEHHIVIRTLYNGTLIVGILDESNPVIHIFHTTATMSGSSGGRLIKHVRTIYIQEMNTDMVDPIIVWNQQVWIALTDGSFVVWGDYATHYEETGVAIASLTWADTMYPLYGVIVCENYEKWIDLLRTRNAQIRAGINFPIGPNREYLLGAAIKSNKVEIVQSLLEMQADPNLPNGENMTCTQIMMMEDSIEENIGRLILYNGGDCTINMMSLSGNTMLHSNILESCPSVSGDCSALRYCLRMSGDRLMHVRSTSTGETPLAYAVRVGCPMAVRILIDYGADVFADLEEEDPLPPNHAARLKQRSVDSSLWITYHPRCFLPLIEKILQEERLRKQLFSFF